MSSVINASPHMRGRIMVVPVTGGNDYLGSLLVRILNSMTSGKYYSMFTLVAT